MEQLLMLSLLMGGGRGGLFGGGGSQNMLGLLVDSQNWFLAKIMGKRYTQRMAMMAMLMGDSGKKINQLQVITQQNIRRSRPRYRRSYRRRYRRY